MVYLYLQLTQGYQYNGGVAVMVMKDPALPTPDILLLSRDDSPGFRLSG